MCFVCAVLFGLHFSRVRDSMVRDRPGQEMAMNLFRVLLWLSLSMNTFQDSVQSFVFLSN